MALEIRPITDSELEESVRMVAYAFNSPDRRNLGETVERIRRFYPNEWSLASFEDGEMTAFIRVVPMAMRINGRGMSFGAVGPVVSLPQHRRKGHVGALLRQALADMRARGQALSGLHTPHPTLYRRYGWEIASLRTMYAFAPKDIALLAQPVERGRTRFLQPDDWAQADRVYRRYAAKRNGPLHRPEVWWREAVLGQSGPLHPDAAIWEDASGEPQGYVIYYQRSGSDPERGDWPPFLVRELVALTRDAYLNLLQYILRHDLPREITLVAAPDDPFFSVVADGTKVRVTAEYDVLLRICDVEQALRLRPVASPEPLALTLRVSDVSAPWNEGTWRVEAREGAVEVERASGEPDVTLAATTLAPVFNGHLSPSAGALAGLIEAKDEDAIARADAFFAARYPPFCFDGF